MPFQIHKLARHQKRPSATIGNKFYSQIQNGGKSGSTYIFAIITDENVVQKPKWGNKPNIQYGGQQPEVVMNLYISPNLSCRCSQI